jgi:acyl-lipid omega-6 desaturase (Delta-12 desaturase)
MRSSREFATPNVAIAAWQVTSTIAAFFGLLALATWIGPSPVCLVLIPWIAGLIVRIFVLQHDCGHRSFLPTKRANYAVGRFLSCFTSIPFGPWRDEHQWHHTHQGRLSKRGVDSMNSPMTLAEVPERMDEARFRVRKIRPQNVFLIGAHSLLLRRKRVRGFFPFRPNFKDRAPDRDETRRSILFTCLASIALQVSVGLVAGWWVWAMVLLPSMVVGAGFGSLLFWVQHNFEHTYHDEDEGWSAANVAIFGSSYLRFGRLLGWMTGHIGLHHVHHLNSRIPNYALERARTALPELAAVAPLDNTALRRSFTHMFWDAAAQRMRSAPEVESLSVEA